MGEIVRSLELEIKSDAEKAVSALGKLETAIDKVASALDKIQVDPTTIQNITKLAEAYKIINKAEKTGTGTKRSGKQTKRDVDAIATSVTKLTTGLAALRKQLALPDSRQGQALLGTAKNPFLDRFKATEEYQKKLRKMVLDREFQKNTRPLLVDNIPMRELMLPALIDTKKQLPMLANMRKQLPALMPPKNMIVDEQKTMNNRLNNNRTFMDRLTDIYDRGADVIYHYYRKISKGIADSDMGYAMGAFGRIADRIRDYREEMRLASEYASKGLPSVKQFARWIEKSGYLDSTRVAKQEYEDALRKYRAGTFSQQDVENFNGKAQAFGLPTLTSQMEEDSKNIFDNLQDLPALASKIGAAFKAVSSVIKGIEKACKSISKFVKNLVKTARNIGKSIKNAFDDTALGRMIGSLTKLRKTMGRILLRKVISSIYRVMTDALRAGSEALALYDSQMNSSISSMTSALSYLKYAFAAAFAPIITVVAPYISAFINMLASAVNAIARFLSALTGRSFAIQAKHNLNDYAKGLKEAGGAAGGASKATEEYQKTLMGFDQIHALNDQNDASGGGGGGGGAGGIDTDSLFEKVSLEDSISAFGKRLRELWQKQDYREIGLLVADKLLEIFEEVDKKLKWENVSEKVTGTLDGIMLALSAFFHRDDTFHQIGVTVGDVANTVTQTLTRFITQLQQCDIGAAVANIFKGVTVSDLDFRQLGSLITSGLAITWDFIYDFFEELGADGPTLIAQKLVELLEGAISNIDTEKITKSLKKFLNTITATLEELTDSETLDGFVDDLCSSLSELIGSGEFVELMQAASKFVGKFLTKLSDFIKSEEGSKMLSEFGRALADALALLPWADILTGVASGIISALTGAITGLFHPGKSKDEINADRYQQGLLSGDPLIGDERIYPKPNTTAMVGSANTIKAAFSSISPTIKSTSTQIKSTLNLSGADFMAYSNTAKTSASNVTNSVKGLNTDTKKSLEGLSSQLDIASAYTTSATFNISTSMDNASDSVQKAGDEISRVTSDKMGKFSTSLNQSQKKVDTFNTNVKNKFTNASSTISSQMDSIKQKIDNAFNSINRNMGGTISYKAKIQIPELFIKEQKNELVAGQRVSYPVFDVRWKQFAKGGFPNIGDMFIANEKGPEMIGSLGRHQNTVANNKQIVEGIKRGVTEAMMNVFMATNSNSYSRPYEMNVTVRTESDEVLARAVQRGNTKLNYRLGFG